MQDLFHDYNLILQMKVDLKKKVRLLSELMTAADNFWSVVGITEEALVLFKDNSFKKAKRIQRSHYLMDRYKFYSNIIANPISDCEVWWNKYKDFDKTVFATSSENRKNEYSKIFDIDPSLGLFRAYGYSWKHNKKEMHFLKDIYSKYISISD